MALVTYERVLLHSGGMDSHAAWLLTGGRDHCVYVKHGAPAQKRELAALEHLHALDPSFEFDAIQGPYLAPLVARDGHIAHRNLLLLTLVAAHYPRASTIAYGAVRGEASPDKTPAFMRAASVALSRSENRRIRVVAPLIHLTKPQAYDRALVLDPYAMAATWSCYDPEGPCGVCQACYRRDVARWRAGEAPPPPLPERTEGPVANLRRAPIRHWPAMVRANIDSLRALRARSVRVEPLEPSSVRHYGGSVPVTREYIDDHPEQFRKVAMKKTIGGSLVPVDPSQTTYEE